MKHTKQMVRVAVYVAAALLFIGLFGHNTSYDHNRCVQLQMDCRN